MSAYLHLVVRWDQSEGEAVGHTWYTQHMCWGFAGNSCKRERLHPFTLNNFSYIKRRWKELFEELMKFMDQSKVEGGRVLGVHLHVSRCSDRK